MKFIPLAHNTVSVILILQLSEVVEIKNPGLSDCKTHTSSVMPGSPVPKGQMGNLLRVGSVHEQSLSALSL